jgi:hypothetical protein
MARLLEGDIEAFRSRFHGAALTPGEQDYDRARSVWNGAIDRKPAPGSLPCVLVRCIESS